MGAQQKSRTGKAGIGQTVRRRLAVTALGAVVVCCMSVPPASAQGLFESLFGGLRHAVSAPARQPSNINSFADPFSALADAINPTRQERYTAAAEAGPSKGFCVRTCDGRFFPVQSRPGMSAAESCNSFCPASQTKLYSGSNIDSAIASDGSRYTDLDNAYVYRERVVEACSCNGKTPFGLAHVDVNSDPTLRQGDVVATKTGLMAFTGKDKDKVANFTPIDSYRGLSSAARDKLADVKIQPVSTAAADTTASITNNAKPVDTRAQASR